MDEGCRARSDRGIATTAFVAGLLAMIAEAGAGDTLVPDLTIGNEAFNLGFYGQVDTGVLHADDGRDGRWYVPAGNGNSSTRFGILFHAGEPGHASFGANYEFEYDAFSTKYLNQENDGDPDWNRFLTRKAEIFVDSRLGKLWFGQGSMASDQTAEVDLSGTTVIGNSNVSDLAGGQLFAVKGGGLSGFSVKDVFTNLDGVGRKLRVRYDTPTFAGFTLSGSYGTQVIPEPTDVDEWDAALRYAGEFGAFRVAGAVAYSGKGRERRPYGVYDGSVSLLHVPSGLSLTAASGHNDRKDDSDRAYTYAKIGYQRDFFAVGATALSADVYSGSGIRIAHSSGSSWGLQVVQNFDYCQTQLYLGYREYDYEDREAGYKPLRALLTGARVKF
ncbi:MAG: porin [Bauldia sp.]|uniref:porin n=1 Tax=Bauldia sp. TaxID=2575872 RepID=UPI001D3C5270|nr:porin [Bauldia sp.]MCB1497700.1 porin [Bauldia sp.]